MCSLSLVPSQSVHLFLLRGWKFSRMGFQIHRSAWKSHIRMLVWTWTLGQLTPAHIFRDYSVPSFLLSESNSYLGLCFQRYMYKTPSLPPSGHQCWDMEQLLQKLPKRFPQRRSAILSKVHSHIFDLRSKQILRDFFFFFWVKHISEDWRE